MNLSTCISRQRICRIIIKNYSNSKHLAAPPCSAVQGLASCSRAFFGSTRTGTSAATPILGSEHGTNANEQPGATTPPTTPAATPATPSSRFLSMNVLSKIRQDLKRADFNGDGKLDFEELKAIFRRHDCFTDQEAEQVGELFFVGNRGQPVSHATFLRAVQYQYQHQDQHPEDPHDHHDQQHAYPNPLDFQSVPTTGCWVSPTDETAYSDIPKEFDRLLLKYIEDLIQHDKENNDEK
jgi:hypothetical protein